MAMPEFNRAGKGTKTETLIGKTLTKGGPRNLRIRGSLFLGKIPLILQLLGRART